MQKFRLEDGTQLIGRNALADTMEDLIIDTFGAAVSSVMGYFSLKKRRQIKAESNNNRNTAE